jgi:hypothetical protein
VIEDSRDLVLEFESVGLTDESDEIDRLEENVRLADIVAAIL